VYVQEIERTLYNVALAGQGANGTGVRYFALLHGNKDPLKTVGTCCEGQSTRVWGGVPEHIFSLDAQAPWRVRLNLFEPATLAAASRGGAPVTVTVATAFPAATRIDVLVAAPAALPSGDFALALRIPAWAAGGAVQVLVNGAAVAPPAAPGSYAAVPPPSPAGWPAGVTNVSFALPMALQAWPYGGVSNLPGLARAAFTFGPFLLAATGGAWNASVDGYLLQGLAPDDPAAWLSAAPGTPPGALPGAFAVLGGGAGAPSFVPYFAIQEEQFSAYPFFSA
jgi:DUF1680 family protein